MARTRKSSRKSRASRTTIRSSLKLTHPPEPFELGITESVEKLPDWRLNLPNETALIELKNGCIYEGEISNLVMHGTGKLKLADGFTYQVCYGSFKNFFILCKNVLSTLRVSLIKI